MSTVFNILAILVMVAVVIVLIRGLVNMLRGGSGDDLEQADAGARRCCSSSRWSSSCWRCCTSRRCG